MGGLICGLRRWLGKLIGIRPIVMILSNIIGVTLKDKLEEREI